MLAPYFKEERLPNKWAKLRLANLPQNRRSFVEAGLDIHLAQKPFKRGLCP
jgi:hypothetical protein